MNQSFDVFTPLEASPLASLVFSACMGLVLGSFANVLIARLPKKESILGRSRCPKCRTPIRWFHNIPLFSYLFLRGRCKKCKKKISLQYPFVELVTALLFAFTTYRLGFDPLFLIRDWPFLLILISATVIDFHHRIIPDSLTFTGTGLGLLTSFWSLGFWNSFGGAFLGLGCFFLCSWIYYQLTQKVGLGGGDIKLLMMIGSYLGPLGVVFTIFLSSLLGSVVGLSWGIASKHRKGVLGVAIPYGPFLSSAALVYYFFGSEKWLQFMIPI